MFNSTVLDVAIGLAFTYLLLSLMCTTINEWFSGMLSLRGKNLDQGLKSLLQGQHMATGEFLNGFLGHPLIRSQLEKAGSKPSYLSPRSFSLAVMDLVTPGQHGQISFGELEEGVTAMGDGPVKTALFALLQNSQGSLPVAQERIEAWFNDTMDRASGWYTRKKQFLSVVIAAGLTIFANADTLAISNRLWLQPSLRQQLVSQASESQAELKDLVTAEYADPKDPMPSKPKVRAAAAAEPDVYARTQRILGDLMGWSADWRKSGGRTAALARIAVLHIPGWLLTIVAVSLGAPFWFDTLNRFMNLRLAGKSPAESAKAPHKDQSQPS